MNNSAKRGRHVLTVGVLVACAFTNGAELQAAYTGEIWRVADGGLATGSRYTDLLSINFTYGRDSGDAFFANVLYNNRTVLSADLVGDFHAVSNLDAPGEWRLFELWYQWQREEWSVLAGLLDLNTEFDVNTTGSLFINGAHGIGTEIGLSGENGASLFPVSGLAARLGYEADGWDAKIALFDGAPGDPDSPRSNQVDLGDGTLLIGELCTGPDKARHAHAGYWRYSADLPRLDSNGNDDSNGWYVFAERQGLPVGRADLGVFMRYGQANGSVQPVDEYLGLGAVLTGWWPARPQDRIGVAVARGGVGSSYRSVLDASGTPTSRAETNVELTYRTQINDYLALQPDIQWVQNPSARDDIDDALVIGLRVDLTFGAALR